MRTFYAVRSVLSVEDADTSDFRDYYDDMGIELYSTAHAALKAVVDEANTEIDELNSDSPDDEDKEAHIELVKVLAEAAELWAKEPTATYCLTEVGLSWFVRKVPLVA